MDFIKDGNIITRVDAKYLFHNIAGREITITVTIEFHDKNNTLIYRSQPEYIRLLKDYTETGYSSENIISYNGEKVSEVDHVKIIAVE